MGVNQGRSFLNGYLVDRVCHCPGTRNDDQFMGTRAAEPQG